MDTGEVRTFFLVHVPPKKGRVLYEIKEIGKSNEHLCALFDVF